MLDPRDYPLRQQLALWDAITLARRDEFPPKAYRLCVMVIHRVRDGFVKLIPAAR
jgi:hypothetical protein